MTLFFLALRWSRKESVLLLLKVSYILAVFIQIHALINPAIYKFSFSTGKLDCAGTCWYRKSIGAYEMKQRGGILVTFLKMVANYGTLFNKLAHSGCYLVPLFSAFLRSVFTNAFGSSKAMLSSPTKTEIFFLEDEQTVRNLSKRKADAEIEDNGKRHFYYIGPQVVPILQRSLPRTPWSDSISLKKRVGSSSFTSGTTI
ncbi:hypothetical protein PHYBLDRAFT_170706 [Phycomyces blakesleeanus NRRL 1555(-)]|uniref:Uncharacterized protein n=1 Tax=Phycomyces blakesleeanus (strain ATCC 8743b / DSM 1359 / FGSC 10004 / NBRC 33097 / NRRL 1555) TaxID=763407 RepID=A0A163A676_PHYB8|nr:hypothetical protein PHYBLDRAFT_170706 [Phycomyces blakesleeanus NRRL 1555(-)]OAD71341.1 hypothetical protein PHYBLDRAFT_170706 [Phycomyces blakesleeanus NRRL 1555(-)]|eukprot:XP_018289381.1 hypothetical protein PHYBLDRAFT_170706 [Phycomyces blakesleeanus NRRL 1555(-)]